MTATTVTDTFRRLFIAAYIEAALFTEINEAGEPLDGFVDEEDLAPEAVTAITEICDDFLKHNMATLEQASINAHQAGIDFLLTRNRHGAGFWDRGLGEVGKALTEASHPYGETHFYIGDDGLVYVS